VCNATFWAFGDQESGLLPVRRDYFMPDRQANSSFVIVIEAKLTPL
jgi:hypothetical protein